MRSYNDKVFGRYGMRHPLYFLKHLAIMGYITIKAVMLLVGGACCSCNAHSLPAKILGRDFDIL